MKIIKRREPFIIGIAGGSGAGKSLVAALLVKKFKNKVLLIESDSYYKDKKLIPYLNKKEPNFDIPSAFDFKLLVEHLKQLKSGQKVKKPVYNFKTHRRLKKTIEISPRPIIILEGILILADPDLRRLLDYAVFLDTDSDRRAVYRLWRDLTERKFTITEARDRYLNVARPMHDKYVEPTKKYAHKILSTNKGVEKVVEFLTKKIEKVLGAHSSVG